MDINEVLGYVERFIEDDIYNGLSLEDVRNIAALLAYQEKLQALAVCCMAIDSYSREEIAEMAKAVQP